MEAIAQVVGSYGWAIIALTVIVRMFLLPIMIRQLKASTIQQEKMQLIRPQMAEIQKRQKAAKTQEEQAAVSQAMMALYKKNGISMTGGIGCLPLLIQMPIFSAFTLPFAIHQNFLIQYSWESDLVNPACYWQFYHSYHIYFKVTLQCLGRLKPKRSRWE